MKKLLKIYFKKNPLYSKILAVKRFIKPPVRIWGSSNFNFSSSDSFIWRTDNNYSTIFRYSDIANKYYNKKSLILMIFFDRYGSFIYEKKIPVEFAVNSFKITSDSLPLPKNDYGSFFAFILPNNLDSSLMTQITNRCYVGYSNNGSFYSFLHGNEIAKLIKLENNNYDFNNATSAINEHKKNTEYSIQKDFMLYDKSELFVYNPIKRKIKFKINSNEISISSNNVLKFNVQNIRSVCLIQSDYFWPRPIVFSYRNSYFDVHHG